MGKTEIRALTPNVATDYLSFKANEHPKKSKNKATDAPKRFLSYWNELVPDYFSPEWFCMMVNDLRRKNWEYKKTEIGSKNKSMAFHNALNNVVLPRIKNTWADFGIIKSLIGALLHVFKDSKYQEYLNQEEAEIVDNLETNPKEDEFGMIFQSLKDTYFFDQGIGNQTNSSENEEFFDQAWRVFETTEIKNMWEEERRKLHTYLHEKYSK